MKRGTLMVLKRLLMAALGALGLVALSTSTALADGVGVPAPDLFNNQTACSSRVPNAMARHTPTVVAKGETESDLNAAIGMGMDLIDAVGSGDPAAPNIYDKLVYTIPTMNCGNGIEDDTDTTEINEADIPAANGIAVDVAEGYHAVLGEFTKVYGTTGTKKALDDAQKALDNAIKNGAGTSTITTLTTARDKAREDHQTALGVLNTVGAGPVYQAGIMEWLAKGDVEAAVAKYNTEVGKTNAARTLVDALNFQTSTDGGSTFTSKHVDLDNPHAGDTATALIVQVNGEDTISATALRTWVGPDGVNGSDNFNDTSGALLVPMVDDPNSDDPDDMIPEVTSSLVTVGTIRTDVNNLNKVVRLLEETLANSDNDQLKPLLSEGLKRAKLEQAHFQDQLNSALSSTDDHRTATNRDSTQTACTASQGVGDACYLSSPVTISGENSNFNTANNKRAAAEADLRAKARARETATGNVVMEFESSSSFYQQGVDRRQYLKDVADANVTRAGVSASAGLRKLAEDAQKALEDAQKAQTSYNALVSDPDNPVNTLISELVKSDGDDGQALVDAISGTYDDTQDNADRLDALLTTDADGMESGRIVDIENMLGEGGNVEQLQTDLDALAGDGRMDETVKGNADEITALDGRAAKNESDITSLGGRVTANEEDLDRAWMDLYGSERGVEAQHDDLAACDATGVLNVATCANARSLHNEEDIEDINDKLMDKKEYIDNLAAEIGVDPVTGEGTVEGGMSRIDMIEHTANHRRDEVAHRADERSMAQWAMEIGMDDERA